MIVISKRQYLNSKYSAFFSSKDAYHTRKSISLRDKLSLLNAEIKSIVGSNAKDILVFLMQILNAENPNVMITRAAIAKSTSVSERTVSRCVTLLKSLGLLNVISYRTSENMNAPNIYSLTKAFYAKLAELDFDWKAKRFIENALKAANDGRDKLATINRRVGLFPNAGSYFNQNSVDNFKFKDDIPIPEF